MLTHSTLLATLFRHPLFQALPQPALQELALGAGSRRLLQGATLHHEGDPARHFFILVHGQIKLHRLSGDGQERVLEIVRPGDVFAETPLFDEQPHYRLSATALRETLVLQVQNACYQRLLQQHPPLAQAMLARLSQRLNRRLDDIDNLATSNANHRVVRFLIQAQESDSGIVNLDVPKRLIASKLGIQPETFSRILHRLISAGLIRVHNRRIEILDPLNLAAYQREAG